MKSNMSVNVEFLAETPLEEAVKEAREKAIEWNVCYICFSFNGIEMHVGKHAVVDEAVNGYRKAMASISHKYACCN